MSIMIYTQTFTVLFAAVYENLHYKCIEMWDLDPAWFLSAFGSAWKACLKKTELELQLLTDVDALIMVWKFMTQKEKLNVQWSISIPLW